MKRTHYHSILPLLLLAIMAMMTGCGEDKPQAPVTARAQKGETQSPSINPVKNAESPVRVTSKPGTGGESTAKPAAEEISLEDLQSLIKNRRGKPLLVNFWATWCAPCIEEMPGLVSLYESYREKMDFLAISADGISGTVDAVPAMMQKLRMIFPTKILRIDDQNRMIQAMDPQWPGALPATFIYNPQGERKQSLIGGQSREEFETALRKILNPNGEGR